MTQGRISRRSALVGLGAAGLATAADAFALEPYWLEVTSHDVPVAGLPVSLEGLTVAQVTDAHLSELGAVEEAIVHQVRRRNIPLVALTGDLIGEGMRLETLHTFISALKQGGTEVVACLGNWEHWAGVPREDLSRVYSDAGARLLVNEARPLAAGLTVCATDDATSGRPRLVVPAPKPNSVRLLLTHSPVLIDRLPAQAAPVSLSLAGHTHGGQVRLGPHLVPYVPPGSGRFVSGWYETAVGRAYVSRGTGHGVLPVRLTCRPELPVFRLLRA